VSEPPTPANPPLEPPLLRAEGLVAGYAASRVLFGVDVTVPRVGTVSILGRNGAGKTTLLRTVMGYVKPTAGRVLLDGVDLTGRSPATLVKAGVGYVPQEQGVFAGLTVRENLLLGLRSGPKATGASLEEAFTLFPKLADRASQQAGTMSGGERKMLSIARALLARPRLLVMDEPTEGVWVGVVDEILGAMRAYAASAAILLVEQHFQFALDLADSVLVLDRGRVVISGDSASVDRDAIARRLAP
jgi:branched-chain amino acid transport system ATP-binding protein